MSDFPLSRHVCIGGVGGIGLGIWVWMDEVRVDGPLFVEDPDTGAETTWWAASWDVTVENASLTSAYEFYPFAQLYVLEVIEPDGLTHTAGAWGISAEAHNLIGLAPLALDDSVTVFQPGEQRTVRVAALIPAPEVWRLGYVLDPLDVVDIEEMVHSHSIGSNVGVWINAYDPTCTTGEVTLIPEGTFAPGAYVPGFLLTRHPVMDGFWTSRGFGCVETPTGLLGAGCPADRPWLHNGVDYAIYAGSPYYDTLPVAGSVTFAGVDEDGPDCSSEPGSLPPHTGYGNFVRHTAVVGGHEVVIWGAHLSGFNTSTGESTTPGQTLGYIGSTGCSTGAHLHCRNAR